MNVTPQAQLDAAVNSIMEPEFSPDEGEVNQVTTRKFIEWAPNLMSNGNWRPTVTPREGTQIHPLDPRGRNPKPIPIYLRLDERHRMPERIRTPRVIPLERLSHAEWKPVDPREVAQPPINAPNMERMTRQAQLEVRKMSKTTPKILGKDELLGNIMADMRALHNEQEDNESQNTGIWPIIGPIPSTPASPDAKPKTTKKRKMMSTNDPQTKRPRCTLKPPSTQQAIRQWRPTSRRGLERRPEHNYTKRIATTPDKTPALNPTAEFLIMQQKTKH